MVKDLKLNRLTVLYAVLGVVAAGIVVFTGWYVVHSNANTSKTYEQIGHSANATTNAEHDNQAAPTQPAVQKTFGADDAATLVKTAYDNAAAYVKRTTNADKGEIDSAKPELSDAYYAQMVSDYNDAKSEHDPFTCAQEPAPDYTISYAGSSDGILTISVNEDYSSEVHVYYGVDLSMRKIVSIDCSEQG